MRNSKNNDIFKIQVSVSTTEARQQCLVYNKSRSIIGKFPVDKELKKLMGKDLKKYVYGRPDDRTGRLVIDGDAPWQNW